MTDAQKKLVQDTLGYLNFWEHYWFHKELKARADGDQEAEKLCSSASASYGNMLTGAIQVLQFAGISVDFIDTGDYKTDRYEVKEA